MWLIKIGKIALTYAFINLIFIVVGFFYGQYFKWIIYHFNLGLYRFFGSFLTSGTIFLMTIFFILSIVIFIMKKILSHI